MEKEEPRPEAPLDTTKEAHDDIGEVVVPNDTEDDVTVHTTNEDYKKETNGSILANDDGSTSTTDRGRKKQLSRIGNVFRSTEKGIGTIPSAHEPIGVPSIVPVIEYDEDQDVTWGEVMKACCCHSSVEWLGISFILFLLILCLYFFLFGLDLLSTAFKVVGGCTASSLLGSDVNPLASILIGIIATALLQSSSTSTSIVVSMCGAGLDVQQAIYVVMGANVGSAITSMLVSLTHMGDGEELERAFAGSSLYFLFNAMTLLILLPLEVGTHYLYHLTKAMLPTSVAQGDSWNSPFKAIVSPLSSKIIISNKKLIDSVAAGLDTCDAKYPVSCTGNVISYDTCEAGLIGCDKHTGICPVFFMNNATKRDDMVAGWVCLVLGIIILCVCLIGLVAVLRKLLLGASTRIIYKATSIPGVFAIMVGCGVTVLVQSSAVTLSALVPLAGIGALKLENMYPLILGADIGTTITALMAALVSTKLESLQIALVHLMFNVTGLVIWYPIPFMRNILPKLARGLGKITKHWKGFPGVFILAVFFLLPVILLGISTCFEQKSKGFTALGIFIVLIIVGGVAYFYMWWRFQSGRSKCAKCISKRQRRTAAINALADDLDYIKVDLEYCKNEIGRIKNYAHIPHTIRMEEGKPVITFYPHRTVVDGEEAAAAADLDDQISLYESCQSLPWRNILMTAAGSIQDEIGSTSDRLGSSLRSQRRALQSSMRSSRRALNRSNRSAKRDAPSSVSGEEGSKF